MATAPVIPWELLDLKCYYVANRVGYDFMYRNPSPCRVRFQIAGFEYIDPPLLNLALPVHLAAAQMGPSQFQVPAAHPVANQELVVSLIDEATKQVKAQASQVLGPG
jgi:hypothetical protein